MWEVPETGGLERKHRYSKMRPLIIICFRDSIVTKMTFCFEAGVMTDDFISATYVPLMMCRGHNDVSRIVFCIMVSLSIFGNETVFGHQLYYWNI